MVFNERLPGRSTWVRRLAHPNGWYDPARGVARDMRKMRKWAGLIFRLRKLKVFRRFLVKWTF